MYIYTITVHLQDHCAYLDIFTKTDGIFGFLNGYVNFIDGSLVEWDGGWVVVWLDDGDWVG